ncbi:MAG: MFS transporter [Gammaproteobacteria bacterium]|nr:MFS transporter [Gammaproteobacteria bacterium]MDH5730583.1 MFS transporter [Gammaproteobacteria bacterium]
MSNSLYWRLSGFYLFYFASLGAIVPYWGLYLQSLDYSIREIGEIVAVITATKIVAPNIWGWIADHTGQRINIIRSASLFSVLIFSLVFWQNSYGWMMAIMLAYSFFWNATLPQFEAVTLSHLDKQIHRYSNIRLWGSIGFVISVGLLGAVLEQHGAGLLPVIIVVLLAGIWISSLLTPDRAYKTDARPVEKLTEVFKKPTVIALFIGCFLLQASHGPYYAFFSIYLEQHGYSRSLIGQLWALGVIAEIVIFMFMQNWLPRFGARFLLLIALLLTALRWYLTATQVDSHLVIFFAQLLHAASFGVFHAVAIHLIYHHFPGRLQGRGQALYSSLSFGAGGAFGALYAGYLWNSMGSTWVYLSASILALMAAILCWSYIRNPEEKAAG